MVQLRDYQIKLKQGVYQGWADGFRNVLAVAPTGSGKAMTLGTLSRELAIEQNMPNAILVHRKELVSQLCMTLAQLDVPHNIIAQRETVLEVIEAERRAHGKVLYDHRSIITVLSVDTFNSRIDRYKAWAENQRAWILDEAAHLLKDNKWGRAVAALPNAIGVGFTATPERLDKKGLGRHAFGVFDHMVEGPEVKWLINEGYLSKYKIVVPESDYRQHLTDVGGSTTDYTATARAHASLHSHIIGDVVKNYIKWANGKQAIVFADSIEAATRMEKEFLLKGITAKVLTGITPSKERLNGVFDFRDGKIKVLINVDLFDEGFDVPGIECVIMARPTKSLSKYRQICGRGLRPMKGKDYALLIDHVGNIKEHGLPDNRRSWTLDNIVRKRDTVNLLRTCQNTNCNAPFDRWLDACPHCGNTDKAYSRSGGEAGGRAALEIVDGDLALLDPDTLREMQAECALEDPAHMYERVAAAVGAAAGKKALKSQQERIAMQKDLARVIALWAGVQKSHGLTDRQINKKFYIDYDMTITMALSEKRADMENTKQWVLDDLPYDVRNGERGE